MTKNEIIEQAIKMKELRREAKEIENRLVAELDSNYRPFGKGQIANGSYGYGSERRDFSIERIGNAMIEVGDNHIKAIWKIQGGIIKKDGSVSEAKGAYAIKSIIIEKQRTSERVDQMLRECDNMTQEIRTRRIR